MPFEFTYKCNFHGHVCLEFRARYGCNPAKPQFGQNLHEVAFRIPYLCHYNLLLNTNISQVQTINYISNNQESSILPHKLLTILLLDKGFSLNVPTNQPACRPA